VLRLWAPEGGLSTVKYILKCTRCSYVLPTIPKQTVCPRCQGVLFAEFAHEQSLPSDWIATADPTLWRYAFVLPPDPAFRVTLGEGFTPILTLRKHLVLKDEGRNPTGTFKARGAALAISMAKQFGIRHVGSATAGNAGGAAAVYAQAAGLKATIIMPRSAPEVNQLEVRLAGARLELVDGTITDAAARLTELCHADRAVFPLSTMQEPYRVEGKKTMGYEIWEQRDALPANIIYPTGGGTGLVGIWKAFQELRRFGLVDKIPTRMFAVQSTGCAPVVRAWEARKDACETWLNPKTLAPGLCVPRPYGDYLILRTLRESHGGAVAVPDREILQAMKQLGRQGILACPEGAATYAAYRQLVAAGSISATEETLLLMTGSGYKYLELYRQ
jgi:threonine synthase